MAKKTVAIHINANKAPSRPRKGSKIYQHGEHFDTVVEVLREDCDGEFLVTGTDEGPDLEFFIKQAGRGVWVIANGD